MGEPRRPGGPALSEVLRSVAARMAHAVARRAGGDRARTARGNAWEAVCADRERAVRRDELRRTLAGLTAAGSTGRQRVG
jgi:hypothetical protein